jgi:hypothetical protein
VCGNPNYSEFDPILPVFYAGGRFLISDSIGIVARIGTPSISVGVTFLL